MNFIIVKYNTRSHQANINYYGQLHIPHVYNDFNLKPFFGNKCKINFLTEHL